MKRIVLILLAFVSIVNLKAQSITVASFEKLPNDMAARVANVRDVNSELCALLKIETSATGFHFQGFVEKTEQKVGEIYVFVSPGIRFLTIKHQQLGVLRNYEFPQTIESGVVYAMKLVHGNARYIIDDLITDQHLVIRTQTPNAKIFINDDYVGKDEGSKLLPIGEIHKYRVEAPLYHTETGEVVLTADKKTELNISLKPAFGYLQINSEPNNVEIEVAGKTYTTPITTEALASGPYTIQAFKKMYKSTSKQVVVQDGKTNTVNITLQPNFAVLSVNTSDNDATIYIDGKYMSKNSWKGNLEVGTHKIEVKKDKHRSYSKTITTRAGKDLTETIPALEPICGKLNINSSPMGAEIKIDGKTYGTTPNIIQGLLIGEHTIALTKDGYSGLTKTIEIKEGKLLDTTFQLYRSGDLVINSIPQGANIIIDGKDILETTPATIKNLAIGSHTITVYKNYYETVSRTMYIQGGETAILSCTLNESPEYVEIKTTNNNRCEIYIDGKYEGMAPLTRKLSIGGHNVKVKYYDDFAGKYKEKTKTINVKRGKDNNMEFKITQRKGSFITADYAYAISPQSAFGITFGKVYKNSSFGWYINFLSNFNFKKINNVGAIIPEEYSYFSYTDEISKYRTSGSFGFLIGGKTFYWKLGIGYGKRELYWQVYPDNSWFMVKNNSYEDFELSIGFQLMLNRCVLSLDVLAPIGEYGFGKYCEARVGIGVNF